MRTTLDIDPEVLQAAKELGRQQGRTAGEVLSDLARQASGGRGALPMTRRPASLGSDPSVPAACP